MLEGSTEAAQLLTRGGRGQGHGPVVGEGACLKLHVLLPGLHLHLPLEGHRVRVTNRLEKESSTEGEKRTRQEGEVRVRTSWFQSPEERRGPDLEAPGWPLRKRPGKAEQRPGGRPHTGKPCVPQPPQQVKTAGMEPAAHLQDEDEVVGWLISGVQVMADVVFVVLVELEFLNDIWVLE